jgi:hypothetical protein
LRLAFLLGEFLLGPAAAVEQLGDGLLALGAGFRGVVAVGGFEFRYIKINTTVKTRNIILYL